MSELHRARVIYLFAPLTLTLWDNAGVETWWGAQDEVGFMPSRSLEGERRGAVHSSRSRLPVDQTSVWSDHLPLHRWRCTLHAAYSG
jgi:hypothetical protein